jgi:hypothetical protein
MLADQGFILHQRRAGHHVADFLGRAAHVDVDDLGAVVDVVAGRFGHHLRVGAGDLHRDRRDFALVVGAAQRLGAAVEQRVRGDHFGHRQPGAHFLAQLAERTVRHAGHGGDEQIVAQREADEFHGRATRGSANCTAAGRSKAADFTRVGAQKIVKSRSELRLAAARLHRNVELHVGRRWRRGCR